MTEPGADVTVTDQDPQGPGAAPDAAPGPTGDTATPADPAATEPQGGGPGDPAQEPHGPVEPVEADPEPDPAVLAAAGALGGQALADHLGAPDLEVHAEAMAAQGVPDGTEAPPGVNPDGDAHRDALREWADDPKFGDPVELGGRHYVPCDLCGGLVDQDRTDRHVTSHIRTGS